MFLGGISGILVGNRLTQPITNEAKFYVKSFDVIIIIIILF